MAEVFDYTIPVLHPLIVHVPIAFLPAAAVVSVGWLLRDRVRWLLVALWLLAAGFLGALVAVLSGEAMEEQSEGVPMVERLGHVHEEVGEWTLWVAGVTLIATVVSLVWHRRAVSHPGVPAPWRWIVTLLAIAAAALVLWTGHVGGVMVWGVPR